MYGRLSRIESSNKNLRTNTVDGKFDKLPSVGDHFEMIAESLDPLKNYRFVSTSIVLGVQSEEKKYLFDTLYSKYELEIYDNGPLLEDSLV